MDQVDSERLHAPSRSPAGADRLAPAAPVDEPRSFAPAAKSRPTPRAEPESPLPRLPTRAPGAIIDLRPRVRPCAEPDAEDRVLVVVSCLDARDAAGALIAGVLRDKGLKEPLVVVVDGGGMDATRARLAAIAAADPRVRVLTGPKLSPGAGVNLAVRLFGHGRAWLVRMDASVAYPEDFASRLILEGRRTAASAVVVAMEARGDEPGFQRAAALASNSPLRIGDGPAAGAAWVEHGRHALFRLTEFLKAGGYDEGFGAGEEAEFDLRLARGGGRIWRTDAVNPRYRPSAAPGALWRQGFDEGRGYARTTLRRRTRPARRQLLTLAAAPAVACAAAAPLFWPAALPALAWAGGCLAYGAILGLKARDGWAMLSGAAAMEMQLAWSLGFWTQRLAPRRAADRLRPARSRALDGTVRIS